MLATIGILLGLIGSTLELPTVHTFKFGNSEWPNSLCYNSVYTKEEICSDGYGNTTQRRQFILILMLIIDLIAMWIWVNYKKQFFNLKWCELKQK